MAKEIEGYRNERDWDTDYKSTLLAGVMNAVRSHDGWLCPYCRCKSDPCDAELNNNKYFQLLHESFDEPLKLSCGECGKDYFLRAMMTVKYYTCEDKEFGDGGH